MFLFQLADYFYSQMEEFVSIFGTDQKRRFCFTLSDLGMKRARIRQSPVNHDVGISSLVQMSPLDGQASVKRLDQSRIFILKALV